MYKHSVYNYCSPSGENYLIYNTLYNTLVRLNGSEYKEYLLLNECDSALKEEFLKNGLFVSADIDEFARYVRLAQIASEFLPGPASVTITTTMECNARCPYCYEAGVPQKRMPLSLSDKIISFIRTVDTSHGLQLTWFGGEPLMNTELIDDISGRLTDSGVEFSSFIITNGSLINDGIIEKMATCWRTVSLQISLDGTYREYKRIKNYADSSELILYDIFAAVKKLADKNIAVNFRLNITKENVEDCVELAGEIGYIFGGYKNVTMYPAFVTGCSVKLSEEEMQDITDRIMGLLKDHSKCFSVSKLHSVPKTTPCIRDELRSFVIDVSGSVYKCEHRVGKPGYASGSLEDTPEQINKNSLHFPLTEECRECVFLPKCMGGCCVHLETDDSPCFIDKYTIKAFLKLI